VQGEFQDNAETVDGRFQHRWVDAREDEVPEDFQPFHARSVSLTAPEAGVCCRMDLLEETATKSLPLSTSAARLPKTPAGLYDPHQIQLAAQWPGIAGERLPVH